MSDIYIHQGPPVMRGGPAQESVERLNRRFDVYRNRHNDYEQRFVQSTNAINEETKQQTQALQKRFLEPKAKKGAKKSEKRKCEDSSAGGDSSSTPGRPSSAGGGSEYYEPPKKIAISNSASKNNSNLGSSTGSSCNSPSSQSSMSFLSSPSGLSSSANSQPSMHYGRQNDPSHLGSPKVDVKPDVSVNGSELMRPGQPTSSMRRVSDSPVSLNNSHIKAGSPMMTSMEQSQNSSNSCQQRNSYHPPPVREVKREDTSSKISGFVDLEQCAAALEKDAAHNGGFLMSGLTGIGDYDPLMQDLISDISNNDFNFDDFEEPPQHIDLKLGLNSLNMPPMPVRSLNNVRPTGPPPIDTRPINAGSVNKNHMNGSFHPMWQQQQQQQQQGNAMYSNCNPAQSNQHSTGPGIMFQQQQTLNIHRDGGPMKCHVSEASGNHMPNLGMPPMQDLVRSQQHLRPPMGNQQAHLPPQQQQHMQNGWMSQNGRTGFIRPGHNPNAVGFQPQQQPQHYPNAPNGQCHQSMDLQNAQNARNWYHNNTRMPVNNSNNFPDGYVDNTGAFVCRDSSYGYANRRT